MSAKGSAARSVFRPPSDQELLKIFGLVLKTTGIDLRHYKPPTIKRRIAKQMSLLKMRNVQQYIDYLKSEPSEVEALSQDVLIKVTSFFRDPEVFKTLCQKAIPSILKHRTGLPLRIWVPGCCTGEEVYSVAISVLECLESRGSHVPVQIFGTDISDWALDKARAGIYSEKLQQQIPKERLERFFVRTDGGFQIHKNIRAMCTFAKQNLAQDPPFSKLDLISCRNVLIYLGVEMQNKIFPMFHYALNPWGFLMLGKSETIGGFFPELFAPIDKKHNVYSKKPSSVRPFLSFSSALPSELKPHAGITPKRILESGEPDLNREVDRTLASRYAPAAALVNEAAEIVQTRGDLTSFLKIAPGKMSVNILKMAREGLMVELKLALERVRKKPQHFKKKEIPAKFERRSVPVDIEILPVSGPLYKEKYYLIVFQRSKFSAEPSDGVKASSKNSAGKRQFGRLKQELEATKSYLQSILEEHEVTHQELRSANEEILSSNEELQSTNEEMETAKEELESTNEELTTVNEELAARNAELQQTKNELEERVKERTAELARANEELKEALTEIRKAEQNLADFFENAPIGLHWVGPDGTILRANKAELELLDYPAEEYIGRNISEFHAERSEIEDMLCRLKSKETLHNYEATLRAKDGSLRNVLISSNVLWEKGKFIHTRCFTRDVTEKKRQERELRENLEIMEAINQVGRTLSAELNLEKLVQAVTDAGTKICGAQFGAFFYNVVNAEGQSYTLYTISGVPREKFSTFPMPRNTKVFAPTFEGTGVVRSADIKKDPRYGKNEPYKGMPEGHLPVTSYLAVPVKSRSGEVLGGLFFGHSKENVFTENHERILSGLAAQAAVAMDNAKLFEALMKQEERFRELANAMPQIVWTARGDGHTDYYNDRWYEFTGFKRGVSGDESWVPVLHPDDLERTQKNWKTAVETGQSYQNEYRFRDHKTGKYRWFLGRALPVKDKNGKVLRWFGTSTDIHDQKITQQRLQLQYKLSQTFIESSKGEEAVQYTLKLICEHLNLHTAGCWLVDEKSDKLRFFTAWNSPSLKYASEEFLKITREFPFTKGVGIPGMIWEKGEPMWLPDIPPTHRPRGIAAQQAKLHSAFGFPIKLGGRILAVTEFFSLEAQTPDEEVLIFMKAIGDQIGSFLEKKRIEEEVLRSKESLERSNKELERSNRELEQFAYVASHDLQEPLRMVTAYTQLLEARYKNKLDDEANQFIHFATEGALRSQSLINDLLEYSRVRSQEKTFAPVDTEEAVNTAISNLAINVQETGAEIVCGELPEVMGEKTKLVQLFQNLLSNALKFRRAAKPRVEIRAKQESGSWIFSIKDNGIGIDSKYHDRIFVIFQRLHTRKEYAGTGIGLAICKKIVEQHRGRIWVESEPGSGTTFYFSLPAAGL